MELDGPDENRFRFGSERLQFAISRNRTTRNGDPSNFLRAKPLTAIVRIVKSTYFAATLYNDAAHSDLKLARAMRDHSTTNEI
jgi:hypothetical protein